MSTAKKRSLFILFGFLVFLSCAPQKLAEDLHEQGRNAAEFFSDQVTTFRVDVYYESSAAPYTGPLGTSTNDMWQIVNDSYATLFQTHTTRTIVVPHSLEQMMRINDQSVNRWSGPQLIQLASSQVRSTGATERVASVFFLHGTYEGDLNILGVHFSGYRFAFVFKDVISTVNSTDELTRHYAEQASVVHELGHVVGLVNGGVPMQSPHEDTAHPGHAIDNQDVMFWDFVSKPSLVSSAKLFVSRLAKMANEPSARAIGGPLNLFGAATLEDAWRFHTH
jgi:hypothetical protein